MGELRLGDGRGHRTRTGRATQLRSKGKIRAAATAVDLLEPRVLLSSAIAAFGTQATFGVGANPYMAVTADVNSDGKLDVLAVSRTLGTTGSFSVLLGNGDGTFVQAVTFGVGVQPMAIGVGDFNRDGKIDAVVVNNQSKYLSVLLGNGDGTFVNGPDVSGGNGAISIAVGDVNGDGRPDIAVANYADATVSVMLGNGNGTFTAQNILPVGTGVRGIAMADFNRDGRNDLVVANQAAGVAGNLGLLVGNGDGSFAAQKTFAAANGPTAVAVGDVDGDGKLDVVVSNTLGGTDRIGLLNGNGDGTFQPQKTFSGAGFTQLTVALADVNGDGKLDVVAPSFSSIDGNVTVLLGNGNNTFQGGVKFSTGTSSASTVVADVNADGRADLVAANYGSDMVGVLLGNVPPVAVSLSRTTPPGPVVPTTTTSVTYTLTFNEPVTGVDQSDFVVSGGGTTQTPLVSGSGAGYTITINGITNFQTLQLSLSDNGSIKNAAGNPLQAGSAAQFSPAQTVGVGQSPYAALPADVNGDGRTDLVVPNFSGNTVGVLLGNGNGTFQVQKTFASGPNPMSVASADFNRDGKIDVVVAHRGGSTAGVLLGNGDGTFQAMQTLAVGNAPCWVISSDVNLDGAPDIVVANLNSSTLSVLLGNGNGTFQAQQLFSAPQVSYVSAGDLNGDGRPDLVFASPNINTMSVMLGNGNGTFGATKSFAVPNYSFAPVVSDVNGDGKADLVTANAMQGNGFASVFLGNGNGTFQTAQTFATAPKSFGVAVADVNGDGRADLATANRSVKSSVSVLIGNGNGTFQAPQTYAVGNYSRFVSVADLNGDGRADLVATSNQTTLSVLFGNGNGSLAGQTYYFSSIQKTLNGTINGDTISLVQDGDHAHVDWFLGTTAGQIAINDAAGLTINGLGGIDWINLDYTNGNPLPNSLHLNGDFNVYNLATTDPLAGTTLDMGQSTVTVFYPISGGPGSFIGQYLKNGYNGGAWNGVATASTGAISSSAAAGGPAGAFGVGWIDAVDGVGSLVKFSILLRYTRMGDVNLDRVVDSNDAIIMARNYLTTVNPRWDQGNFNFDTTVNMTDAQILQKNYSLTATGSVTAGVVQSTVVPPTDSTQNEDMVSRHKKDKKRRK